MEKRNEHLLHKLPDWATAAALYTFQVRQATQYAMCALDSAGILLTWNTGVQNILGYSEQDWLGQHASLILTPADQAFEVCAAEMKLAAESGYSSDTRWHRLKDVSELFYNVVMRDILFNDGLLIGF
jgi:PAS domain S-box-containing protein